MQLAVTQSLGWQPPHLNCINQLFTQQSCLSIASSQNVSSDVSVKCIITSIRSSYFYCTLLRKNHDFSSNGFQNKTSFLFETSQPRISLFECWDESSSDHRDMVPHREVQPGLKLRLCSVRVLPLGQGTARLTFPLKSISGGFLRNS